MNACCGIRFVLAYGNIRHQGSGSGGNVGAPTAGVVPLSSLPFEIVRAYDQELFPAPRGEFLRPWLAPALGAALGIVHDGRLQAYGVVRASHAGYKIGPLIADTPELAETLFLALQAQVPQGVALFLDTPACNPQALALAKRHTMFPTFETARMYQGACPVLPLARLFGVTSFELGMAAIPKLKVHAAEVLHKVFDTILSPSIFTFRFVFGRGGAVLWHTP